MRSDFNTCVVVGWEVASPTFPMRKAPTVYQAELTAILKAAGGLFPCAKRGQIIIHTHLQAALKANDIPVITS